MKVFGIILEASPLHFGHLYFIKKIKQKYQPDLLIALVSTNFTMRGEISVIDKFTKTSLLLENGVDLILELPFSYAVQSADYFAKGAIQILNLLNVTDIAFGSETSKLKLYETVYERFNNFTTTTYYNKKISFKQSFNAFLENSNFTLDEKDLIIKPNFTLGFQYIKNILDQKLNINYHLIKRIKNNYDDILPTNKIASATSIRKLLKEKKDLQYFLPYQPNLLIDLQNAENQLVTILGYVYHIDERNLSYFGQKEGINSYIKKNGDFYHTFDDLITSLKNKKYTNSLIRRTLLHNLLETSAPLFPLTYLRILGLNQKGTNYLNTLPLDVKKIIFSSPKEIEHNNTNENNYKILETELKATMLYQIITRNFELYYNEYKLPIRKD